MFTPPKVAGNRHLLQPSWAGRGVAVIAAVGWLTAAGASTEVVPASLQAPDTTAEASPATGGGDIRNRLEKPVWPTRQAQAQALVNAVLRAGEHGLDPDLFHAALLRNLAALAPIERELVVSDGILAYADALARGAVPIENRLDDEDLTPEPVNLAATLDNAINGPDPAAVVEALAPNSLAYAALRRTLQAHRSGAARGEATRPGGNNSAARQPRPVSADATGEARLRQIAVNLERQRWLPRTLPADRVWVNTATAELTLYRADQPAFATHVIVGQVDKQTPEFRTTIDSLLYNPPWNVPRSIITNEIGPKLGQDPGYLARHHMVMRHNGGIEQLPPSALGQLKFEMTDRFDVYLHDTPDKHLFTRANRRQSHGCIRVQNPRELGALLLQQPVAAINKGIAPGSTNRQMLPAPIPVFVVYQTAFLDSTGAVTFVPDAYQRDDEIWRHLQPVRQAPVAEHEQPAPRRG